MCYKMTTGYENAKIRARSLVGTDACLKYIRNEHIAIMIEHFVCSCMTLLDQRRYTFPIEPLFQELSTHHSHPLHSTTTSPQSAHFDLYYIHTLTTHSRKPPPPGPPSQKKQNRHSQRNCEKTPHRRWWRPGEVFRSEIFTTLRFFWIEV